MPMGTRSKRSPSWSVGRDVEVLLADVGQWPKLEAIAARAGARWQSGPDFKILCCHRGIFGSKQAFRV